MFNDGAWKLIKGRKAAWSERRCGERRTWKERKKISNWRALHQWWHLRMDGISSEQRSPPWLTRTATHHAKQHLKSLREAPFSQECPLNGITQVNRKQMLCVLFWLPLPANARHEGSGLKWAPVTCRLQTALSAHLLQWFPDCVRITEGQLGWRSKRGHWVQSQPLSRFPTTENDFQRTQPTPLKTIRKRRLPTAA